MDRPEEKTRCPRQKGILIHAPMTSFLDGEEARWLVFITMRSFWEQDGRPDYMEVADHIVSLLHRYMDAVKELLYQTGPEG